MSSNRECAPNSVWERLREEREGKKEKKQVARSCNKGMRLELREQGWRGRQNKLRKQGQARYLPTVRGLENGGASFHSWLPGVFL